MKKMRGSDDLLAYVLVWNWVSFLLRLTLANAWDGNFIIHGLQRDLGSRC
jgi:hypothetical protein